MTVFTGQFVSKEDRLMITKYNSPRVKVETRKSNALLNSYYRTSIFGDNGGLMLIMLFCFLVYGLLFYYMLPSGASYRYARVSAELSYYWGNSWHFIEYQFYSTYLPALKSLLQDLLVLLPR